MVDYASGGARKLSEDSIHVTLVPLEKEVPVEPLTEAEVSSGNVQPASQNRPTQTRLEELKTLRDQGYLTPEEYEQKRSDILQDL